MIRWGPGFFGLALVGELMLARGLGSLGPCADDAAALAGLFLLVGLAAGTLLLLAAADRAKWRSLKQRRSQLS
jgi:hypothetical protein